MAVLIIAAPFVLINIFALVLIVARGLIFRVRIYRPMLLNIGLSILPLIVAAIVLLAAVFGALADQLALSVVVLVIGGPIWLLLLPNSGYLITELNFSHRTEDDRVPLWYDIVAVLSLALSGILNLLANVLVAQAIAITFTADPITATDEVFNPFSHPFSWAIVAVVLLVVSFGIYLGRYIRFDSWDVLRPMRFLATLFGHFHSLRVVFAAFWFTVLHAILFAILYLIVVSPYLLVALSSQTAR